MPCKSKTYGLGTLSDENHCRSTLFGACSFPYNSIPRMTMLLDMQTAAKHF
jgi:hypothetical protein